MLYFRYREIVSPSSVVVCAPTGTAALNIAGRTMHSVFSLPVPIPSHTWNPSKSRLARVPVEAGDVKLVSIFVWGKYTRGTPIDLLVVSAFAFLAISASCHLSGIRQSLIPGKTAEPWAMTQGRASSTQTGGCAHQGRARGRNHPKVVPITPMTAQWQHRNSQVPWHWHMRWPYARVKVGQESVLSWISARPNGVADSASSLWAEWSLNGLLIQPLTLGTFTNEKLMMKNNLDFQTRRYVDNYLTRLSNNTAQFFASFKFLDSKFRE